LPSPTSPFSSSSTSVLQNRSNGGEGGSKTPSSQPNSATTTPIKSDHPPYHVNRSPATSVDTATTATTPMDYNVIFEPGPVGLQLEPVTEDPKYGCRVVRFVDGFPKNPGQARKSGKINPGDLVVQVMVDYENDNHHDMDVNTSTNSINSGTVIVATTYDEIIAALKRKHSKRRIITFRSVSDPSFLDLKSKFTNATTTATMTANNPYPNNSFATDRNTDVTGGATGSVRSSKRFLTIQTKGSEEEKDGLPPSSAAAAARLSHITKSLATPPRGLASPKKHIIQRLPSEEEEEEVELANAWKSPPASATKKSSSPQLPAVRFTSPVVFGSSQPTGAAVETPKITVFASREDFDLMTPFSQAENIFLHDPETPAIPALFTTTHSDKATPSPIRFSDDNDISSPYEDTTFNISMVNSPSQMVLLSHGLGKDYPSNRSRAAERSSTTISAPNGARQDTSPMQSGPSPRPPPTTSLEPSNGGEHRSTSSPLGTRASPLPPPPPPPGTSSGPRSRPNSPAPSRFYVPTTPLPRSSSYPPRPRPPMPPTTKGTSDMTQRPPPPHPTSGPSLPMESMTISRTGSSNSSHLASSTHTRAPETSALTSATAFIVREFCCEGQPTPFSQRDSPTDSQDEELETPQTPLSEFDRLLSPPLRLESIAIHLESSQFSPSKVKTLTHEQQKAGVTGGPRLLSRVFSSVYRNVGPAVATSTYVVGSAVVNKVVPTVASSSYALGSALTSKLGELMVGNSSDEFQKESAIKLQLLQELSQAKVALDIQGVERTKLEQVVGELLQDNNFLRATQELAQSSQVRDDGGIGFVSLSFI
jgi:hypothetical protein